MSDHRGTKSFQAGKAAWGGKEFASREKERNNHGSEGDLVSEVLTYN